MSPSSMSTQQFERTVDHWVRDAVAHGHASLDRIIRALPGVYPSVVRDALRRVASQPPTAVDLKVLQETLWPQLAPPAPHVIALPVPHPLDYDWRFSEATVADLLNMSGSLAAPGAAIALLGTPSIMRAVIEVPRSYQFTLLEANAVMTTFLTQVAPAARIVRCDVGRDPLPDIAASVVIADPPWYEEHIRSFLWAACQLCHVGGSILMSVPPIGTRPGIAQEWERTQIWAEQLGLALVRLEPNALEYLTPQFERNALRADGLDTIRSTWRRGNLAIFIRQEKRDIPRPSLPSRDGLWDEVQAAGVRIRLRRRTCAGFADPSLVPIVPGQVLPSVSRRDPRRRHADVWTSGNRVFLCRGTPLLATIIHTVASGQSPVDGILAQIGRPLTALEQSLVTHATWQVKRLLACEQRDSQDFWEGTVHDKPVHLVGRRTRGSRSG